jgi:hypothetical protein
MKAILFLFEQRQAIPSRLLSSRAYFCLAWYNKVLKAILKINKNHPLLLPQDLQSHYLIQTTFLN